MSSKGTPAQQAGYRPDIDGLRAVAILSVLIFHAFPKALPGGFVGVDIFFVISGFLISGIILKSLRTGAFSYIDFYRRRVKRIFPALGVILAASLLAGWLVLFPEEWKLLGKHVFAGTVFLSNLALMREGGYFDSTAKPLLHLWSLGIEEQFYLVWPLLLAFAYKKQQVMPAMLLILATSFALDLWFLGSHPVDVFYLPATRFWELALGAVLAYGMAPDSNGRWHRFFSHTPRRSLAYSLAGFALLIAALVFISEKKAFPGAWALLPTGGAFLTIAAGPRTWFNRVILSSPPMTFLGLISYPLYLWHWPMLYFARVLNADAFGPILAVIVLAIGLSYLTYLFVETPLRHHRSTIAVPCVLLASVGTVGLLGLAAKNTVQPRLQSAKDQPFFAAMTDWNYPFGFNFKRARGFKTGQITGTREEEVLFVGDSHAEQYFSRVKTLAESHAGPIDTSLFLTYGACPPLPGVNRFGAGFACDKFFQYAMGRANGPLVKTVVFSAYWELYFGYGADGDKSSKVYSTAGHPQVGLTGIQLAQIAFKEFGAAIKCLRASGKRVFVISSNPASSLYSPKRMISRMTGAIETRDVDQKTLELARPILERLRAVSVESGATVIDPVPSFCNGSICKTTNESGLPLYKDDDHLRSSYAAHYATFIDQIYRQPR